MPKPQIEAETARLEARVPVQVYDQMQRAARLRGMTLTGYLISHRRPRTRAASSRKLTSCAWRARTKSASLKH